MERSGFLALQRLNILNIAQQVMEVMVNDYFGLLRKLGENLNNLKSRWFLASSLSTYDFSIVGEPKSHIVQKHTFFAPERYTAENLYTDSLNSA